MNRIERLESRSILVFLFSVLVSLMAFLGYGCSSAVRNSIVDNDCTERLFKTVSVQKQAVPSIVRIISHAGDISKDFETFSDRTFGGTGFILANTDFDKNLYIVTNYHVIAGGMQFSAEFLNKDGRKVNISGLEVVKVDPVNDLALLVAPRIGEINCGLSLNMYPVEAGQEIIILGFPYVKYSGKTVTVEKGQITSVDREIYHQKYIQTNANINPGNSGGPALDACGSVIGVVVALISSTERTGLIIPASKVAGLYNSYKKTNNSDYSKEIKGQLVKFFDHLIYNEPFAASGMMSRDYLHEIVTPVYKEELGSAVGRYQQIGKLLWDTYGIDVFKEPLDRQLSLMEEMHERNIMSNSEYSSLLIYLLIESNTLNYFEGLQEYLSLHLPEIFGAINNIAIESIEVVNNNEEAVARVQIQSDKGIFRKKIFLQYEWGDWRIAGFQKS